MATSYEHKNRRKRGKQRSISSPFDITIPSSLRDPTNDSFSNKDLLCVTNDDNAREFALGHLHDHEKFAQLWNSTKPSPNARRWMRKVVQIQTINAVCNG